MLSTKNSQTLWHLTETSAGRRTRSTDSCLHRHCWDRASSWPCRNMSAWLSRGATSTLPRVVSSSDTHTFTAGELCLYSVLSSDTCTFTAGGFCLYSVSSSDTRTFTAGELCLCSVISSDTHTFTAGEFCLYSVSSLDTRTFRAGGFCLYSVSSSDTRTFTAAGFCLYSVSSSDTPTFTADGFCLHSVSPSDKSPQQHTHCSGVQWVKMGQSDRRTPDSFINPSLHAMWVVSIDSA